MKKLLIATLALTAFAGFAPSASAGHRDEVFVGYDRCGRPVYRENCRPSQRYYEERPSYYRAAPQVRYRDDDDDRCRPQRRSHHRSPLAFVFGF